MIQENIFYENNFYHDLGDLMDGLDIDEEMTGIEDDWSIEVQQGVLEPIFQLTQDMLYELASDRFPEESESTEKQFAAALRLIDFEKVNGAMPQLYYPARKKEKITKQDLIDWCK